MKKDLILSARKEISKLIIDVLLNKKTVKDALLCFPKKVKDDTIDCAWHALCHFEADELQRAKDALYREEQDNYLYYIASLLEEGKALPEDIISDYKEYYGTGSFDIIKSCKNFIKKYSKWFNF